MSGRDVRIDVIRGAGILMIALDHLGALAAQLAPAPFVLPFVTWTRLGWSSAAEFFVFFSGYLVGSVFMTTLASRGFGVTQARGLYRAWQIYAANTLTCCVALIVMNLAPFADGRVLAVTRMDMFSPAAGGQGLLGFLTLQSAPMFFEILYMYLAFLSVAGLMLVLVRAHALAAVLVSGALWLFVQWQPGFNPGGWHFNPYAWQFAFVLGIVFSRTALIGQLEARFGRRRLLAVTASILAGALLVKTLDKTGTWPPLLGDFDMPGIDKRTLGPLRLVHFLVSVVFVTLLLPDGARLVRSWTARIVARVGQHSLECFCLSTLLAYAGAGLLVRHDAVGSPGVLALGMIILVALCAAAGALQWLKSKPWRSPGAPASLARPAPDARPARSAQPERLFAKGRSP